MGRPSRWECADGGWLHEGEHAHRQAAVPCIRAPWGPVKTHCQAHSRHTGGHSLGRALGSAFSPTLCVILMPPKYKSHCVFISPLLFLRAGLKVRNSLLEETGKHYECLGIGADDQSGVGAPGPLGRAQSE